MSDTQKTTKAVREAPTASQGQRGDASTVADGIAHTQAKQQPGTYSGELLSASPRYTVELTTEGWQVRDTGRRVILADAFGAKKQAQRRAEALNGRGERT